MSLARQHTDVRVIDVPNGGLSAARNSGLAAATGKIVAYTDADCRVDADWLTYLVQPILVSDVVGAGGPNITPPDDSWVSQCVARAPGEPTHVMLNDRIAEHVPGCNMAFRRDALLAINGFNPVYVCAGDDVDICWRFQANKLRIGFAPSAVVWHHRRPSVLAYWRQQVGYGEGEAWLEAHHPEKFLSGQMMWRGRIYSQFPFLSTVSERRVNTGVWGTAAFPSVYSTQAHQWHLLPHSPLWMAMSLALLFVGVFGPLARMDAAWLPLVAGLFGWTLTIGRCLMCGWRSELYGLPSIGQWSPRKSRILYRGLIAGLHLLQPLARLKGRLSGLSRPKAVTPQHVSRYPWKSPMPTLTDFMCAARLVSRGNVEHSFWSESWTPHATLLNELVGVLRASRPAPVVDVDDGWCSDRDLSLAIGRWGWLHVRTLVEEHERGSGLFRVRVRLSPSFVGTLRGLTLAVVVAGGMSRVDISLSPLCDTLRLSHRNRSNRCQGSMAGYTCGDRTPPSVDTSYHRGWPVAPADLAGSCPTPELIHRNDSVQPPGIASCGHCFLDTLVPSTVSRAGSRSSRTLDRRNRFGSAGTLAT